MGSVIDFLTSEVPQVQPIFFTVPGKVPGFNTNTLGRELVRESFVDQPLQQTGLAHLSLSYDDQLGFIEELLLEIALHSQNVTD